MDLFSIIAAAILSASLAFGLGLGLRVENFRAALARPKAFGLGLGVQFVLLPAVAFSVGWVFGLPAYVALGLVLLASCPGGSSSNYFSYLAKGDVSLSILLTGISSSLSFLWVPFIVSLGLDVFATDGAVVRLPVMRTVTQVFLLLVLPVSCGVALNHWRPLWAQRITRPLALLAFTLLMAFSASVVVLEPAALWQGFVQGSVGLVAYTGLLTGLAWALARAARLARPAARVIVIEGIVQNFAIANLVALSILEDPRLVALNLAYMVIALSLAFAYAQWARRG